MREEIPHQKTHDYLDVVFRFLFLIALFIFIPIFIYKVFLYPNQSTVIWVIGLLIALFVFSGGFYSRIKSLRFGPVGTELFDQKKTEKKLETSAIESIKNLYTNFPEEFPIAPSDGIIDATDLSPEEIKKIGNYKKILEDLEDV